MTKFYKNKAGLWDSPKCRECCSDCSSYYGEPCPLDFEGTCDNCVFKNGYKKNLIFNLG